MQHSKGLEWFCLFGARVLFLRLFAATGVIRPTPVGSLSPQCVDGFGGIRELRAP